MYGQQLRMKHNRLPRHILKTISTRRRRRKIPLMSWLQRIEETDESRGKSIEKIGTGNIVVKLDKDYMQILKS